MGLILQRHEVPNLSVSYQRQARRLIAALMYRLLPIEPKIASYDRW